MGADVHLRLYFQFIRTDVTCGYTLCSKVSYLFFSYNHFEVGLQFCCVTCTGWWHFGRQCFICECFVKLELSRYFKMLCCFSPMLLTFLHEHNFGHLYFYRVLTLNVLVALLDRAMSLSPGTGSQSLQSNAVMHEWLWTEHIKIPCYFAVTSLRNPCSD